MLLHFIFDPPNWSEGTMKQVGYDTDGWGLSGNFTFEEIPDEFKPILTETISSIVSQDENWQCQQAWVTKGTYIAKPEIINKETGEIIESATFEPCLEVRAEVKHKELQTLKVITSKNYPFLRLTSEEHLKFFDYFSKRI